MNTLGFEDWVASRWDGHQPEQQVGHPVPFPIVAALGLAGETGEVVELLKKHYRDGTHPGADMLLELGDVLHYLTVIAKAYGWSLEKIMNANVRKLDARDAERGRVVP